MTLRYIHGLPSCVVLGCTAPKVALFDLPKDLLYEMPRAAIENMKDGDGAVELDPPGAQKSGHRHSAKGSTSPFVSNPEMLNNVCAPGIGETRGRCVFLCCFCMTQMAQPHFLCFSLCYEKTWFLLHLAAPCRHGCAVSGAFTPKVFNGLQQCVICRLYGITSAPATQ